MVGRGIDSPPQFRRPILAVGLGCSLGVREFDPWPNWFLWSLVGFKGNLNITPVFVFFSGKLELKWKVAEVGQALGTTSQLKRGTQEERPGWPHEVPLRVGTMDMWVWVKMKPPGVDRRF